MSSIPVSKVVDPLGPSENGTAAVVDQQSCNRRELDQEIGHDRDLPEELDVSQGAGLSP